MYRVLMHTSLLVLTLALLAGSLTADRGRPDAVLADGARYYGTMRDGRLEGRGVLAWSNGDRYSGTFHNGLMAGQGRFDFGDGDRYRGGMVGGRPGGTGEIVYADGSRYIGHFAAGYPDGQGRLTGAAGQVYEGQFRHGRPDGLGRLQQADGNVYTGAFRHGRVDGPGRMQMTDGSVYVGTFAAGSIRRGVLTAAGKRRYAGEFRNWHYDGEGVYTDADGSIYRGRFKHGQLVSGRWTSGRGDTYDGAFEDGVFNGLGVFRTADGDVYRGRFKAGSLDGIGVYDSADGDHYTGGFSNWRFDGAGKLELANGDVYEGGFRYGEYDGKGTLTHAAATADAPREESGTWVDGELRGHTRHDRAVRVAEQALYSQSRLLDGELNALQPAVPGRINLYFVGVAGNGTQEVFRREAEYVDREFAEHFGTRGHAVLLVNSRTTADRLPLATHASLRRTLTAVAKQMDPQRDILFLFLTSHGSHDHELSLAEYGITLADLKADELGDMLKQLPLRYKVVVISACYSGGFIKPLDDGHTLIITAARADRTSFGCADENDFTYFGRAFFKESVPHTASFVAAFDKASKLVRQWEDQDHADYHSHPQIHREPAVEAQLGRWRQQLEQQRVAVRH